MIYLRKITAFLTGAMLLSGALCNVCLAKDNKTNTSDSIRVFSMSMLQDAAYEGEWISFYDEFKLYLPKEWTEFEVAESDAKNGILYQCGRERTGENLVLSSVAVKEGSSLEQLTQELTTAGYESVEEMQINSIPAVRYRGMKVYGLSFLMGEDRLYTMICGPQSSDMTAITDNIFISLSPYEE